MSSKVYDHIKLHCNMRIKSLSGDEDLVGRLQELGVRVGSEICLVGRAPFAGPWLVRLNTTVIALRENEIACLHFEVIQ